MVIVLSCYHPLKGFRVGTTENGKADLRVVSYSVDHLEYYPSDKKWHSIGFDFVSSRASRVVKDFVSIPCGRCVGCRMDYSRQWALRCMLELQYHESAYFVTLTYDDAHVPVSYYSDPDTGEALPSLTLRKSDFQKFMKRLRFHFSDCQIRFFAAGEYGSTTYRPHYHAIIFGLKLDDLVPYSRSAQGYSYYNSESLQRCWSIYDRELDSYDSLGYAVVGEVTFETAAYTARYVMKKLYGSEAEFYSTFSLEPPFTLMSRRPGIARQYFEDHPDLYESDFLNISTPKGGKKFKPPRYFDQLYDIEYPDKMEEIKKTRRKIAEYRTQMSLSKTDLSYLEYLQVQEDNFNARIKSLERKL